MLLFRHMLLIACTAAANVVRLFFRNSRRCLGYNFRVVWCSGSHSILVNVTGASTTCRVGSVALVAGGAFADDFAIGIGCIIWSDVGGT